MGTFTVRLFRYHPEQDEKPRNQDIEVDDSFRKRMVLDVLEYLKTRDPTLTYRPAAKGFAVPMALILMAATTWAVSPG